MPAPLPTDAAELEAATRELVADVWRDVPGVSNVHTRPRYTDDEREWLEVATVEHAANRDREVSFVFISFTGFDEVEETTCATLVRLRYEFDVAASVADRVDSTNSHDDFVARLMNARAAFKANRSFGYESHEVWHNLLQTGEAARVEELDGALVHRTVLTLEIEIRG